MKSLKITLVAFSILWMVPMTSQSQDQESLIMNITEFTIKYGQDSNFTDGVKKWNKCYKDNDGKDKWNVWHRLQGKGNVYVLTGTMANWAEMDKKDAAATACRSVAIESIRPYIESTEFNTARTIPELSRKDPLGDMSIVWVTDFTVKDDEAFNDVIKEVSTTVNSKEGSFKGYWYRVMGGEGVDYFVSEPFKDFAALDADKDSVWKIYESVHGKSKTKEIRAKFRASIDRAWSYLYTFEKEISMQ